MNKKLLVVALASAFAAPAAMADVTISGTFNPAVVGTKISSQSGGTNPVGGAIAATPGGTTQGVTSQYSNFTISSVEDLGDGNKATGYLQVRAPGGAIDTTGNNTLNGFRFHVGLEGGWGSLKIGREFSPYTWLLINNDPHDGSMSLGASLQILGNSGGGLVYGFGNPGNGAQNSFFGVASNAVFYDSPNMGGFKVRASYAFAGGQKTVGANGRSPTELSASVEFAPEDMPFFVSAALSRRNDWLGSTAMYYNNAVGATGSTDTAAIVGGGLKFGGATVRVFFEQLSYKTDVTSGLSELKRNAFWLNASYALETGMLGASIISAGDATGTNVGGTFNGGGTGATSMGLSYFHDLSKQTKPFIVLNRVNNKERASYSSAGSQPIGAGVAGSDHTVLMVGIKHSF
jgi:predicted porin